MADKPTSHPLTRDELLGDLRELEALGLVSVDDAGDAPRFLTTARGRAIPSEDPVSESAQNMRTERPLDGHNACPVCPLHVRNLYAAARRALEDPSSTNLEELHQALEALRPFIEAHHANQLHAFSAELEPARHPRLPEAA